MQTFKKFVQPTLIMMKFLKHPLPTAVTPAFPYFRLPYFKDYLLCVCYSLSPNQMNVFLYMNHYGHSIFLGTDKLLCLFPYKLSSPSYRHSNLPLGEKLLLQKNTLLVTEVHNPKTLLQWKDLSHDMTTWCQRWDWTNMATVLYR